MEEGRDSEIAESVSDIVEVKENGSSQEEEVTSDDKVTLPEERKISVAGENKVSENGKRKLSILSERLGRVVEEV